MAPGTAAGTGWPPPLLDHRRYPAPALIRLYHERWEIELVIDEIDTHQRLLRRTLRSKTPDGVIQELLATVLGA